MKALLNAELVVDHGEAVDGDNQSSLLDQPRVALSKYAVQLAQRLLQATEARLALGEYGTAQVADQIRAAHLVYEIARRGRRRHHRREHHILDNCPCCCDILATRRVAAIAVRASRVVVRGVAIAMLLLLLLLLHLTCAHTRARARVESEISVVSASHVQGGVHMLMRLVATCHVEAGLHFMVRTLLMIMIIMMVLLLLLMMLRRMSVAY